MCTYKHQGHSQLCQLICTVLDSLPQANTAIAWESDEQNELFCPGQTLLSHSYANLPRANTALDPCAILPRASQCPAFSPSKMSKSQIPCSKLFVMLDCLIDNIKFQRKQLTIEKTSKTDKHFLVPGQNLLDFCFLLSKDYALQDIV